MNDEAYKILCDLIAQYPTRTLVKELEARGVNIVYRADKAAQDVTNQQTPEQVLTEVRKVLSAQMPQSNGHEFDLLMALRQLQVKVEDIPASVEQTTATIALSALIDVFECRKHIPYEELMSVVVRECQQCAAAKQPREALEMQCTEDHSRDGRMGQQEITIDEQMVAAHAQEQVEAEDIDAEKARELEELKSLRKMLYSVRTTEELRAMHVKLASSAIPSTVSMQGITYGDAARMAWNIADIMMSEYIRRQAS